MPARVSTVWYFAYGSNMSSATLRGRRGVEYRQALAARADGWRLVLDKPSLLRVNHSFANIVPDAAASVLGVLFEVTAEELAHIELTEGVRIGNYQSVELQARPLGDGGHGRQAFSLTSERRNPALLPSTHYMSILIAGAEEHGLPAEYVDYLRSIPAREEDAEALRYRQFVDEALRRSRG
jgi:cation transport regulator ChaC